MATIRSSNNPDMLVWARMQVGYSIEQAAEALGVSIESLTAAETGEKPLTLNQLRTAADKYSCPFGYFYLTQPPTTDKYQPVPDFRVEPSMYGADNYRLQLEIKKVRDRRLVYLDLLVSMNEELVDFDILQDNQNSDNTGEEIRSRLNVSEDELFGVKIDQVYTYWKNKIEDDNVLVYESQYIPDDTGVIGLAIYYPQYPIILIKRGGSSKLRKLFTLIHEYAHLLKGKSAFNDANSQTVGRTDSEVDWLEAECNRLAAEILVPSNLLNFKDYGDIDPAEKMVKLSDRFKVTYTTAAVCLRQRNFISDSEFQSLLQARKREFDRKNPRGTSGGPIPRENIQRLDLGKPMFRAVLDAYESGHIDIFDASKILNLRVKKIDPLIGRNNI